MIRYILRIALVVLMLQICNGASAQFCGHVVDAQTNEPIAYATVQYVGTAIGTSTDDNGNFELPISSEHDKLKISFVGYSPTTVSVNYGRSKQSSTIKLYQDNLLLDEVVVRKQRHHYRRKDNPAVELMRRVIANKYKSDLKQRDYYSCMKYQRHTTSINEVSAKTFTQGWLKSFGFLKDHVEPCAETGKLILPLVVDETYSEELYRRSPRLTRSYVRGTQSKGFNTIFSSGDFFTTFVKDIFTDVNIYEDNVRLLQHPFISPISSSQAITFYHYYIEDTIMVADERCIDVTFSPSNPQDFGFSGHLYITDNADCQVKRCVLNIPKYSGVNFVENLIVLQDFEKLSTGEYVLKTDNMVVELKYIDELTKLQVQRYTGYSNHSFAAIDNAQIAEFKSEELKKGVAGKRDSLFWQQVRPLELTETESNMEHFIDSVKALKGYQYAMLALRALIENSVELTKQPNKLDLIPVNTIISHNYVDGLRFRLGGQTTGNLNPHLFLRGYAAYGCKDNKMKYKGEVEYSFNAKDYMAHEFPRRSVTFTYLYDDMSPIDRFSGTDKDNMYTSMKSAKVDQMMYVRQQTAKYVYETERNLTFIFQMQHGMTTPTGKLNYRRVSDGMMLQGMETADLQVGLRYAPGETFINSKQRRQPINSDAPIFTIDHTTGLKGVLGGEYRYNMTEVSAFKRFWLPYAFGYFEAYLKAGMQWNKVPFPMLFIPSSNLSYIVQFDSWSFNMLRNMEFLNDRYASLFVNWNFDGKLFNRVPLLRKLKLREYVGCKVYYGMLSDKNNPYINTNDNILLQFPERDGVTTSFVMGSRPYMEFSAGISNIFKFLTIEYVRRLNYLDMPSTPNGDKLNKNGVRFAVDIHF